MSNPIPGMPAPEQTGRRDQPGEPRDQHLAQAIADVATELDQACAALTDRQPELHAARVRDLARGFLRDAGLHLHITECETPWLQFGESRCTARVTVLATLRWADAAPDEPPFERIKASGFATRYVAEDAARAAAAQAETQALSQFFGHHAAPIDEVTARNQYEAHLKKSHRMARDKTMRTMKPSDLKPALERACNKLHALRPEEAAERIAFVLAEHGADVAKPTQLNQATAWFTLSELAEEWELYAVRRASE